MPESSQGTRSVTQGVGSSVADVQRICSTLQVEPRDLWLVDSGATCHVLAASYASSFRIVRNHGVSPKLFNASSDEIAVEGFVDIELSFHGLEITLQEVIVAHVAFNALSPWAGAEHGWKLTWVSLVAACLKDGRASSCPRQTVHGGRYQGRKERVFQGVKVRVLLNLWSWTHCLYVIQDPRLQERRRRSPKP